MRVKTFSPVFLVALLLNCQSGPAVAADAVSIESSLEVLMKARESLTRFDQQNGMICLVKEDRSAPVVAIQIWIGTGSIHEQEHLGAGISHAIEHMIFKGTDTRPPGSISKEIDGVGGEVNAYTSFDRTVFYAEMPSEHWQVGLDVLADAVMNASFPEEEWLKEREVILREMAMGKDSPERVLSKLMWRTAYSTHPYKYPVIGYPEVFREITRQDLADFADRNYLPDNMITVVVGNVDPIAVRDSIEEVFKDFQRKARAPVVLPEEPAQISPRFARETGEYNVSRVSVAFHTVSIDHPDAPALDALAWVAGKGRSSRLVQTIKEDRKLVHAIDAWSYTPKHSGVFGVDAVFDPQKEGEVLAAIKQQVSSWRESDFSEEEVARAVRSAVASELSDLETMKGMANSYATGQFYAGDPGFGETYLANLAKVTPARLKEVASKHLRPENMTVAILSPELQAEEQDTKAGQANSSDPAKVSLPGGATLLTREDNRIPLVSFCVAIGGGNLAEPAEARGICHLASELITRGTKDRTSRQIAEEVESLGARLTPFSGYNSFGLQGRCMTPDAEAFAEILADCIINSVFDPEEVEKQRTIQLAQIRKQMDNPMFVAQINMRGALFDGHPYNLSPLGTANTVSAISAEDLRSFYEQLAVSGNIVISIFGDIANSTAQKLAESVFAELSEGVRFKPDVSAANPRLPATVTKREPRRQAILLAGFPGIDICDERLEPLEVLQKSMGGLSSDLAIEVRDKRGLAYFVGSFMQTGPEPGFFGLYAGTRAEAIDQVRKLFADEIDRVTASGLRKDELDRARNQLVAASEKQMQNNMTLAMECAISELVGVGYRHPLTARERFDAVTAESVRAAAESVLSTNRVVFSIVLPKEKGGSND